MNKLDPVIEYIHFHFVSKEKSLDSLPKGGVTEISAEVQEAYSQYIVQITKKRQSDSCHDIFHNDTIYSHEVKSEIDTMLRRPVPQEVSELETSATKLAIRLVSKMKKASNPKSGVLFQIVFRENGIRKICFLKLAEFHERYFDYDEKKSALTKGELLEKLPFSGRFQKGALYPPPSSSKVDAYMKVYQSDSDANYFEEFLGGAPEVSARDIMKEFKRLSKVVTGKPLSLQQNLGLFEGIRTHLKKTRKQVSEKDVVRIMQEALPSTPKKLIKDSVHADIGVTGIVDGVDVEDLKMIFRVGGLRLSGSYSDVAKQFKFEGSGPNKHTIHGKVTSIELGSR